MLRAVARLAASGGVAAGGDVDTGTALAHADANPYGAAAAAVFSFQPLGVLRGNQADVVCRVQRHVQPGFNLAADGRDIAARRGYRQVITRRQRAARGGILSAVALGFGRLRANRGADTKGGGSIAGGGLRQRRSPRRTDGAETLAFELQRLPANCAVLHENKDGSLLLHRYSFFPNIVFLYWHSLTLT